MKKIIGTILVSFLLLTVFAGQSKAQGQQRVQDPTSHDEEAYIPGESGTQDRDMLQDPTGLGAGIGQAKAQGLRNSTQSLNRIVTRENNPEVGAQIRVMVESHEQVQRQVQTALGQMESRPAYLKLLIGPDYKNAGQLRSSTVGIRNDIRQLTNLKTDLDQQDSEDIESAIAELEAEADSLEAQLSEQLSGFSLFGWLGRMISGY